MSAVTWWADLQRLVAARRRLVAACLVGLSVLSALSVLRPAPPPTVAVLAAARDLVPGAALALEDLRTVALPPAAVPSGALRPGAPVLGRVVAGPVRQGEPLTDVRLVGPSLLAAADAAGSVAVPVRFADPGAVALLRPGDRIDVLAVPNDSGLDLATPPGTGGAPPATSAGAPARPATGAARVVAAGVVVLAVPAPDATGFGEGALVVVACAPGVARALAAAAATERLSPALLPAAPALRGAGATGAPAAPRPPPTAVPPPAHPPPSAPPSPPARPPRDATRPAATSPAATPPVAAPPEAP